MSRFVWALTVLLVVCGAALGQKSAGIVPERLKCEWQVDPAGIDTARPHFSWTLRGVDEKARGLRQTAYQLVVSSLRDFAASEPAAQWDSGKILSAEIFQIEYAGNPLRRGVRYYWKVKVWDGNGESSPWSETAEFLTGQLHPANWEAQWIAAEADKPPQAQSLENAGEKLKAMPRLPIFRREFSIKKKVKQALVFVSGLGQYELHLNGANVTDRLLTPGWTNYRKTVFYNTYDVTQQIKRGKNAVGVLLGSGMYDVPGIEGRYTKFIGSFGQPKLILELHVLFDNDTELVVNTDHSWTAAPGPITFSSTYGGEDYDGRLQQEGWDEPGFRAAGWRNAIEVEGPGGTLVSEQSPPIRVLHTYEPAAANHPRPEVTVYDLGQNLSGWPEIQVKGRPGSTVKLIAGELLDSSGLVTQRSANAAPSREQSYSYTLKGGTETWHPRFSYWGFRYVQVEGIAAPGGSEPPSVLALRGQFIHDDVESVGTFDTSNELFKRIYRLIDMAVMSNMFSVLTDCPHREKLGWLEQTYLAGSSILLNHDAVSLYRKMAQDIRDSQLADGMVPGIAPEYVAFVDANGVNTSFRDSPEWGSAAILSPWAAYQFYGDRDLLAAQYDSMRACAGYLRGKTRDHILGYGLGDWYDIGPGSPGESQLTSKAVTATAIYYADLIALSKVAATLGKQEDSAQYAEEAGVVKDAFNRLFHVGTGQYDRGSQTANAMPLALGMVPPDQEKAVLENLVQDIRRHDNHVTAGDIGFHFLVRALTDHGRSDVLFDMLSRTDSPSYGYQLAQGATTLTEAWDANPNSSQNHFMLGHAQEWFFRGLAGIDVEVDRPARERIHIHPHPVGTVERVAASYRSVLGEVRSEWKTEAGRFTLKVNVPVGSVATIVIPSAKPGAVLESGRPLGEGEGIISRDLSDRAAVCIVGSGNYEFSSEI